MRLPIAGFLLGIGLCLIPALVRSSQSAADARYEREQEKGDAHSLPITLGPEYHDLMPQIYEDYSPMVSRKKVDGVLVVISLKPRRSAGEASNGTVIVKDAKDKGDAQRFLEKSCGISSLRRAGTASNSTTKK